MNVTGSGHADIGRKRDRNEDAFLVDNDLGLYLVCDGLGGHAAGEIASKRAAEMVKQIVEREQTMVEELRDESVPDSRIIRFIESVVQGVCAEIHRLAGSRPEYSKMATTLTALLVLGDRAVMGHVGDSRLYIVRDGEAYQLSDDHTFANDMLRMGILDEQKARDSQYAHALTRSVGTHEIVMVDTLLFDLLPDDLLVLCTDGFSRYLELPSDLAGLVDASGRHATPSRLVQWASDRGGIDNISVVLVEASLGDDDDEELRRSSAKKRMAVLKHMPPFRDLFLRELMRVASTIEVSDIGKGEIVMQQGAPCADYCLVLKGSMSLDRSGCEPRMLKSGDTFGLEALLGDRPALATVRAAEDSRLLRIPRAKFDRICHHRPRMGQKIFRHLGAELAARLDECWAV